MAQKPKTKVIDYDKWNKFGNIDYNENTINDDIHINVDGTNMDNNNDDMKHVKIPRSPRPAPMEAPVLDGMDGLLDAPPLNEPKGVCHIFY